MKILDVQQGSAAWHFARLGIPTASQFDRILTPKTRKLSASADKYLNELLAEWLIGAPCGPDLKGFMERGRELESMAVSYYELQRDVKTQAVGFVTLDNGLAGCSPDRLVGEDGGLEIKCPSAAVHVSNLRSMTEDYYAQAQGGMWITGRAWWDLMSYHPTMPAAIQRIPRDAEYQAALESAMAGFLERLKAARQELLDRGCEPATELDPQFAATLAAPTVLENF